MRHIRAKLPRDLVVWRVQGEVPLHDAQRPLAWTERSQIVVAADALAVGEAAVLAAVARLDAGAAALDAIATERRNPILVGMDGIFEVAFAGARGRGRSDLGGAQDAGDSEQYMQGAGSQSGDPHDCRLLGIAECEDL